MYGEPSKRTNWRCFTSSRAAVSWTAWSVMTFGGNSPVATVAGALSVFGPMVGAVITVKATERSLGPVPGGIRWYLAAILLIGVYVLTDG